MRFYIQKMQHCYVHHSQAVNGEVVSIERQVSLCHDYRKRFSARRSYGFCLCNNEGSDCHSSSASSKTWHQARPKVCFIEHGSDILFQPVTKEYVRSVCGMLKDATSATAELLIERKKDREREQAKRKMLSTPFSW